ncbi:competence type IV pilus assembly protein ComGB [uncultured Metabacillus sp.]|uniref:competence type IV pilus assembly protein ComGB n=1 Tax=uncultured Metabacillus sp. TaxID=2860135 RepID=UPI00261F65A1|nr:competence type IV pilus assembly protein ComGB [uncultured Metabacillus sp.]
MKIKDKWSLKEQADILKRLSSMLEKGYTLNEALSFLYVNEQGSKKSDLLICINQLSSGHSFRSVLSKLHFHRDVLSYLYFAEQHGDMEFALKASSEILHKKMTHLDKLAKILRYPIFLIITVSIILSIVQSVISPQFQQLYNSMNLEQSFFSIFLLVLFALLKWCGIGGFIITIMIILYYFFIFKKKPIDEQMEIMIKIPIVKRIFCMLHSYFFALQLSNLLRGGLSTFESLKIFEKQNILPFYRTEASRFIEKLKAGVQLHQIIEDSHFYEKELALVILHGQANGQLARELFMYSQFVIEKLENKIIKTMAIIQPTIYAFVGVVVLFVYLSMLLPLYNMMENL